MLYYFKTKYTYIKKNIRGIRIKSVVYLDFEMQQKSPITHLAGKEMAVTGISKHFHFVNLSLSIHLNVTYVSN